ncbi:MAG: ABC transporter ATP-binding protein/permease [Lachnospiraceae bacterium]|nr:ABC transporter ATP-binding protein/permease [Lachnospiraceae bacterium]
MKSNLKAACVIFKELRSLLEKKYRKQIIGILFLVILGSFWELLGVYMILPFMEVVLDPQQLMEKEHILNFMNIFGIDSSKKLLLLIGLGIIIIYIFKNLFAIFSSYVQFSFSAKVQKSISVKMLTSYMQHPYTYFINVNSSTILRSCTSDVVGVYNIINNSITIVAELLNVIVIGGFLLYTDTFISIGVLLLMFVTLMIFVLWLKPFVKKLGQKDVVLQTITNKTVLQIAHGLKEIFVMQRKEEFMEEYKQASEASRKIKRNYDFINACPDRVVEGVCISGIIGVVCIRLCMNMDMALFVPKLGVFAMAAFKLFPSIGKIVSRINAVIFSMSPLHNCYENVMEADRYTKESEEYKTNHSYGGHNDSEKVRFQIELVINHIWWQYPNQINPVLADVQLRICKGESVAFIGESGAGKTTLADCILGLLRPQKGTIEMDGIDVYTMPMRWAHIVGYVPQAVFLTDDTIRNNIAFGLNVIDDADIWDALERAQLKKFVLGLSDGLDTIVGERGIKFSGGQKQRLAIARALYNKPEILILDEATAALDNETESAVMESIEMLQGKITMIIVAHRLSTIRNCDKIYEVKNGRIVQKEKEEVFRDNEETIYNNR